DLYQLKGRVGRSDRQGYAYFLYKEKIPDEDAKKRFVALQEASELGSGFELAMKDMEIRGVGNILGKEQHGHAVKIGLNLYVRLLNQAVQELEGIEPEPERDIPIDLPIEARIPEELVPDSAERILMYQKLANIREIPTLLQKRDEYGPKLHPSLDGLFTLLEIKLLAARSPLLSIDTTYPSEMNRIESPRLTITSEQPFGDAATVWDPVIMREQSTHRVRATLNELGPNWINKLKTLIQTQQRKPDQE
ncbi:MAG: TRCF domain-containing protein, partial [Candidatus Kerfeldbacteria bacterium]